MIHISQYNEHQNRALQRVVGMVKSAETRTGSRYKTVRKHDRKEFQGPVLICLPAPNGPPPGEDHPTAFPAWGYSISSGGIGFVALEVIVSDQVSVGLKRPDGTYRWMTGNVVRNRPIPDEEFFDYGVSFQAAAPSQPSPSQSVAVVG